jgi:3-methyladenine DNA glycosylase/8-oxoguanine DNA glycosylase
LAARAIELEVRPPSPWRLPRGSSEDRTIRVQGGMARRLMHVGGSPVLVRAWQPGPGRAAFRAEAVDPAAIGGFAAEPEAEPAGAERLEIATARMRFALAVDDDHAELFRRFRRDPLVGPLLRQLPAFRPRRHPWPWEAFQAAVAKQLIEAGRAATIQRRLVGRWGSRLGEGREALRDVPGPATIAGRAPAELQSMDLSGNRALALRRVARDVAAGRCDLADPGDDRRLSAVPEVGSWTIQCLGLFGRGEADSLPAGDLGYVKLVGRLAGLGRRAAVAEVEEFYAPYEPYRGLVGALTLAGLHRVVAQGPPLRLAA